MTTYSPLIRGVPSFLEHEVSHLSHAVFDQPGKLAGVSVAGAMETGHMEIDDVISLNDVRDSIAVSRNLQCVCVCVCACVCMHTCSNDGCM